jgi:2-polyprenyl-3-methyl-5-hydroxy-6-metoxy-1,4-benzoquinol methylase
MSMEQAEYTNALNDHILEADISCPYCGTRASRHWRKLNFWQCLSCELIFKYPLPEMDSVIELYEKSWTSPSENRSETGGTSLELARSYTVKLAQTLKLKDFTGLRILDFGAGRGDILTALTELGAEMYGVEPFGYEGLVDRGFKMFRTLDDIPEDLKFDGIITIDVVEHLWSPWDEISRFSSLLKNGGFVYISTPNAGSLRARIQGEKWSEALRPGHFVLFNGVSMEKMLRRAGYNNPKRLRWFMNFTDNSFRNFMGYLLQAARIDGELRYLIRKA